MADHIGLPDIGSKLPPSVANLAIFNSKQIKFVQDAEKALKVLALLLTVIVPLLHALAVLLGRRRRPAGADDRGHRDRGGRPGRRRRAQDRRIGASDALVKTEANKPAVARLCRSRPL